MANLKHLKILKQGVQVWNEWRGETSGGLKGLWMDNLFNEDTSPDLSGVDLHEMNLSHANLSEVDFTNANLDGINFHDASLVGADLSGARLRHAHLSLTDFGRATVVGADLSHAFVLRTILQDTVLKDTDLYNARMFFATISNVDLSRVKNLETVRHEGPSNIGINTIYKSRGNIPEKFLRGCGVPKDFLTYMRSLTAKAIEFYSCFISYSSKDEDFAKRLYSDLQSEGVRCWFAPEDLKIGDKFRVRIDESIRLYDKLILILSGNSVSSEWVGDEVEAALEKEEGQEGKVVLFPLRLDGAVMEIRSGWPAKVRRTRHIGDFSDWKNHDSYKKAFERLMRDLKAGEKR